MFNVTFINWINKMDYNDKSFLLPFWYILKISVTDNILYLFMIMTKNINYTTLHLYITF